MSPTQPGREEPAPRRRSRPIAALLGLCALAGASILLTLGAFELGLRWLGYEPIYKVYSHPEIFWRHDDLLGWSHEPNSEAVYVGPRPWPVEFSAPVRINSLGLRGPEIADLPADGYRVMVLGDSMVAAFEVPWEETFESLLETRLTQELSIPVQVIDAGVRGYGTDQSYLYYQERGRRLEPDLVIFLHSANDEADNVTLHRMRRTFSKGAFARRPDGTLDRVGYPIPEYPLCSEYVLDAREEPRRVDTEREHALCLVQTLLSDRSALFTFFSLRISRNPAALVYLYRLGSPVEGAERQTIVAGDDVPERRELAPATALTAAILHALVREVRDSGAELMFLVVPTFWPTDLHPADLAAPGVTLFELPVDLGQAELHFVNDSHLNRRGHAVVADLLGPAVAERIRAHRVGAVPRPPEAAP